MVRVLIQEKHLIELCIKMSPTVKLLKKKPWILINENCFYMLSLSLSFFFFLRLTIFFFSKKKLFLGLKIQWLIS